jgi:hypothetical protein
MKPAIMLSLIFLFMIVFLSAGCVNIPITNRSVCTLGPTMIPVTTKTIDYNVTISNVSSQFKIEHSKFAVYEHDQLMLKIKNTWDLPVLVNGECTSFNDQGEQISSVPIEPGLLQFEVPAYGGVNSIGLDIPLNANSNDKYRITCSIENVSFQYPHR